MSGLTKLVDGVETPLSEDDIAQRDADAVWTAAMLAAPVYVPVALVRERLEAADLWADAAAALMLDPAMLLKVLTLREGIASDDAQAIAWLTAVGADPEVILAPGGA